MGTLTLGRALLLPALLIILHFLPAWPLLSAPAEGEKTESTGTKEETGNKTPEKDKEEDVPDEEQFMSLEEKENYFRQKSIFKAGKYSFGISIGMIPDLGSMSVSGPRLTTISNEMSRIVAQYNTTSAAAPAGYRSSGEQTASAKSAVGIPVGFHFYYTSTYMMFRTGMNYTFSTSAVNEFTGNQFVPTGSGGNASSLATGGTDMTITSSVKMSYFEIPATFALRLVNIWGSAIYFGGGPSYFIGGWRRETSKSGSDTIKYTGNLPDVDAFFGTALGYHFVIGGEIYLNSDIAVTAEFMISQGIAGRASDRVVSKNSNVLKTQTPESQGINDSEELKIGAGGTESGSESAEIQFGGTGLILGVRYLL